MHPIMMESLHLLLPQLDPQIAHMLRFYFIKLLHVSGLNGPSSGNKYLYKIISKPFYYNGIYIYIYIYIYMGARGSLVVMALRYKPAGRGFDSRWCHWNFSVT